MANFTMIMQKRDKNKQGLILKRYEIGIEMYKLRQDKVIRQVNKVNVSVLTIILIDLEKV